jgi:hypothetical protein
VFHSSHNLRQIKSLLTFSCCLNCVSGNCTGSGFKCFCCCSTCPAWFILHSRHPDELSQASHHFCLLFLGIYWLMSDCFGTSIHCLSCVSTALVVEDSQICTPFFLLQKVLSFNCLMWKFGEIVKLLNYYISHKLNFWSVHKVWNKSIPGNNMWQLIHNDFMMHAEYWCAQSWI